MARDAVTIQTVPLIGGLVQATGTTVNATNGASIDAEHTHKLLLIVASAAAAYEVTLKEGVGVQRHLGDSVLSLTAGQTGYFVVESARFIQSDGLIHVDFEAGADGTIHAVRLPRGI